MTGLFRFLCGRPVAESSTSDSELELLYSSLDDDCLFRFFVLEVFDVVEVFDVDGAFGGFATCLYAFLC